ncbi:MAG: hypothetical protein A2Y12_01635 [Planctomycetes bacterium GWF2_42_9]|nr:MAG: hypothetical protein A2Y12_01635 [Planctomycetes bacterium GWF2_42_9]
MNCTKKWGQVKTLIKMILLNNIIMENKSLFSVIPGENLEFNCWRTGENSLLGEQSRVGENRKTGTNAYKNLNC